METIGTHEEFSDNVKFHYYHVGVRAHSVRLWRSGENEFWVTEDGTYTPVISFGRYALMHKKYTNLFVEMPDQLSFQPVKIIDRATAEANTEYVELKIFNAIDHRSVIEQYDGMRIWVGNGNIFVSHDVKIRLQEMSRDEFVFSPGFSRFGA